MTRRLGRAGALALLLAVASAPAAAADEPVKTIDWTVTAPASGTVVDGAVRITVDASGGSFPLVAIAAPDLGRDGYEVRGDVRYSNVTGTGYFEMWSIFPDGGRYFSRTLATTGSMAALTGTSDWRPFELPFFLQGGVPPTRLEINVVLPGAGSVDVGRLEIARLAAGEVGRRGAWLSDQSVGAVGAIVGTSIGLLGAAIGILAGRGRGRRYVLPAMVVAIGIGLGAIALAVIAFLVGQPPAVVGLLALTGLVSVLAFGNTLPRVRRTYAEAELRRMRAMDRA
ncbi:MAG: hypothetical protein E6I26_10015 [Chloroflexi bacterium]|nr:MAG: hypothetical protein E6I26_10015 [Chloroflexota bacterium]